MVLTWCVLSRSPLLLVRHPNLSFILPLPKSGGQASDRGSNQVDPPTEIRREVSRVDRSCGSTPRSSYSRTSHDRIGRVAYRIPPALLTRKPDRGSDASKAACLEGFTWNLNEVSVVEQAVCAIKRSQGCVIYSPIYPRFGR